MITKNKVIIITTIYDRADAIESYEAYSKDWYKIIIGDRKSTPYKIDNGEFITIEDQLKMTNYSTPSLLPENDPIRRNIGILKALEYKADLIAFLDDDNIMLDNWGKNIYVGSESDKLIENKCNILQDCLDCYRDNSPYLWQRGLSLKYKDIDPNFVKEKRECVCQQDFWLGETDVDAMLKLTNAYIRPEYIFKNKNEYFMDYNRVYSKNYHPINSQNTIIDAEYAPLFFQFPNLGRLDDIWSSFIAQCIIFNMNKCVCFAEPTVNQVRHKHDLIQDFKDEILGYQKTDELLEVLENYEYDKNKSMIENWYLIYKELCKYRILDEYYWNLDSIEHNVRAYIAESWKQDIEKLQKENLQEI